MCYAPQGALASAKIGVSSVFPGGLVLTNTYNNRLQPNELKASSTGGNAFDISYNFVDPASQGNAGHVYGITNNIDGTRSQVFTYDPLNRIASAQTTSTHATSAAHCWGEAYTIDPWANLQTIAPTSDPAYTGCTQESGFTKTPDNNNHLSGLGYDLSGNTANDGSFAYTWDGESQLKTAGGVTYTYDGNGRRVSKSNGKYYWYGSGGEILAETTATGAVTNEYIFFGGKRIALLPASGTAQFYAEDLLGSSRVVTTNSGVVCYDADFYPFGGERTPYTNTCTQNAYKFEGKERDSETGNDDFGARYYSNRFGRWLSADWSNVPVAVPYANLTNPQTLNLYAMVSDDPETFADLDGHLPCFDVGGGGLCNANGHESPPPNQQQAQAAQIKYYDVQGATASEAMANANKSAHGGCSAPSAGCTHADFVEVPTTKVTSEKTSSGMSVTGTVPDVKVTVSITTTLPNWTGYAGASASDQKAWDTSLAALKTHEDGHAAIDRAGVKEIKSAILGTTATASGASYQQAQSKMLTKLGDLVATKFKAAIAANQKRNDDYDLANK